MSRTLSYVFFALCAGTLFASTAQAEDYDKRFYLAPAVSYNFFGENGFDNELGAQLSIGRAFSRSLNLELVANTTEPDITGGKATLNGYGLSLLFFPKRNELPFFGILSAQRGDFEIPGPDDKGYNYDLGVGFLRPLNDYGLAYRLEYRYRHHDTDDNGSSNDHVILVGLQIPLGAPAALPPPPPPPPPPAPPVEAPLPPPPPVDLAPKAPVVLKGVNFEFDSAKLTPEAETILNGVVDALKGAPEVKALIKGHTCNIGTSEYNLGLSKRRADSVQSYLTNGGIDGSRLESKGYGEAQPVATNSTKEGREQNRRVELEVLDDGGCVPPTVGDQVDEKGCAAKAP